MQAAALAVTGTQLDFFEPRQRCRT